MSKEVVTEENYKRIVLKRMITLCWIFLFVCFIIKIFGGNFFQYIGESVFADTIRENWFLLNGFQLILYTIQSFLFFSTMIKGKTKQIIIVTLVLFLFKGILNINPIMSLIALIIETLTLVLFPIICGVKPYKSIIMFCLLTLYQVISLITKNISIINFPVDTIVAYVYMIDYYIMLGLTYLYSRQGGNFMDIGFLFLSKDKAQLEAYKNIVIKKHIAESDKLKDKHSKELAKIDAKIAKAK